MSGSPPSRIQARLRAAPAADARSGRPPEAPHPSASRSSSARGAHPDAQAAHRLRRPATRRAPHVRAQGPSGRGGRGADAQGDRRAGPARDAPRRRRPGFAVWPPPHRGPRTARGSPRRGETRSPKSESGSASRQPAQLRPRGTGPPGRRSTTSTASPRASGCVRWPSDASGHSPARGARPPPVHPEPPYQPPAIGRLRITVGASSVSSRTCSAWPSPWEMTA